MRRSAWLVLAVSMLFCAPSAAADVTPDYYTFPAGYGVDDYSFEQCWDDYRYGLFQGPLITVMGAMYATHTDRGDDMVATMLRRGCRAVRELGTSELVRERTAVDAG